MMHHKKETHFVLAILGIAAVVLIANFFIVLAFQQILNNNAINEAQQAQANSAKKLASIFESQISELEDKLLLIAKYDDIKSMNTETCDKKIDEVLANLSEEINNIGRTSLNGTVYCNTNRATIGIDVSSSAHYKKITEDPEHKPVLSALVHELTNAGAWALSLVVPVFDDNGNFSGTLGASIYTNEINENGFFTTAVPVSDSRVLIADSNGDIIFYTKPEFVGKNTHSQEIKSAFGSAAYITDKIEVDVKAGKSGAARYTFLGEDRINSYVPVKIFENRTGAVWVSSPVSGIKSELVSPQTFVMFYMVSSAAALAGILVILFFLRGMVKFSLKNFAEQIDGKEKQ